MERWHRQLFRSRSVATRRCDPVNVVKLEHVSEGIIGSVEAAVSAATLLYRRRHACRYSAGRMVKELLKIFFCVRHERVRKINSLALYSTFTCTEGNSRCQKQSLAVSYSRCASSSRGPKRTAAPRVPRSKTVRITKTRTARFKR